MCYPSAICEIKTGLLVEHEGRAAPQIACRRINPTPLSCAPCWCSRLLIALLRSWPKRAAVGVVVRESARRRHRKSARRPFFVVCSTSESICREVYVRVEPVRSDIILADLRRWVALQACAQGRALERCPKHTRQDSKNGKTAEVELRAISEVRLNIWKVW